MGRDMNSESAIEDRYHVPALARGLQLLTQFNREQRELSGAELSRMLGLPRASVFRMLCTLEQSGFLERCADGVNYKLGLGVLRLGFELLASMELTELGRILAHPQIPFQPPRDPARLAVRRPIPNSCRAWHRSARIPSQSRNRHR